MTLTASQIRAVRFEGVKRKLHDRDGLFAQLQKSGLYWRFQYQHRGRRREMSLGKYPEVSLADARRRHREAFAVLKDDGRDPMEVRAEAERVERLGRAHRFEDVAREWMALQHWSDGHRRTVVERLTHDVFAPRGSLGDRPVGEIDAPEVLETLRRIEARGTHETAKRVRQILGQVFRFAVATGRARHDPAAPLAGALKRVQPKRMAHTTDAVRLGEILRALDGYTGSLIVRSAMRLHPLTVVRPGELRGAEWSEFDLDGATWRIPAERMKRRGNGDHVVPLVPEAVAILREPEPVSGHGRLVFPGTRSRERPISDATMNAAFRRLDIGQDEFVGHGWRHAMSTLANESGEFDPDVIEAALHHVDGSVRGRYNSAKRLPERERLMRWWAARLALFRDGAQVVDIRSAARA